MKRTSFIFIFISFLLGVLLTNSINAIEYGGLGGKPANPNPDNPRSKSIFIYELNPEESMQDEVLVVNNTQEKKTVLVYSTDSQKSTDGSFACEQYLDEKNAVGKWINIEQEELTLDPLTSEKVAFSVNVPTNASVGEQNGCILIQEKSGPSDPSSSGVSLSFRTGLRVVVTVPGEEVRKLNQKNFETSIVEDFIKAKVEITNEGNVSIDTNVIVESSYIFGITHYRIENEYPILREDTSVYNFEIPKPFWGGIIKVSSSAEYDKSSEASVGVNTENPKEVLEFDSHYIFVFPSFTALLIEVAFVLLIIFVIYILLKKKRSRAFVSKSWVNYKIQANDNLQKLAKDYKISWKTLAKNNNLKAPYHLEEGKLIKVPPVNDESV